jgi:hypothetical protein
MNFLSLLRVTNLQGRIVADAGNFMPGPFVVFFWTKFLPAAFPAGRLIVF